MIQKKKMLQISTELRDSISINTHICSLNNSGIVLETGIPHSVITASKRLASRMFTRFLQDLLDSAPQHIPQISSNGTHSVFSLWIIRSFLPQLRSGHSVA